VTAYGSASMTGDLRRVLVRRPLPADADAWEAYAWRARPDVAAAQAEHEAFCLLLEEAGAEVVVSEHDAGNPDAIYTYDPTIVGRDGAVLLQPGKEGRRREPEATVGPLEAAGVPIAARVDLPATVEGGDTVWLDEQTLLVGIGYRTNAAAPLALHDARQRVVEFDTMGANVLALGPRRAVALEGNDETRRRMERAGVDVVTYRGDEISRKGDGGPTCLTRPLLRV